jgi:putative DNA primase/helicase
MSIKSNSQRNAQKKLKHDQPEPLIKKKQTHKKYKINPEQMLKSFNNLSEINSSDLQNKYSQKQIDAFLFENEIGDAEMYIDLFRNKFVYDHIADEWFYWNDHFWRQDILQERFAVIRDMRKIYMLASSQAYFSKKTSESQKKQDDSEKQSKRIRILSNRIEKLGDSRYCTRLINSASKGVGTLGITGKEWDKKTKLLVVKNGCIDLNTGKFKKGKQDDFMKTYAPVELTPKNKDYLAWEQFLLSSQDGDMESVKFIQKLLGYSLLGTCERHIFPIFYGYHGRNGKSTIFEILKEAFGDLMYRIPNDFLIKKKNQKADGAPDSVLMGLRGRKIVWCSEIDKGDMIDLPKIKGLTGGDTITARGIRAKNQIEFIPTFTTFLLTNRLAHVDAGDDAFWNRAIVIPFTKSFVSNPTKKYEEFADIKLKETLQKILPGIVRWVIEGSLLYQEQGLELPASIKKATLQYRNNEDRISEFIEDYCVVSEIGSILRSDLFLAYKEWCSECGYSKLGKKNFYKEIELKFGEPRRTKNGYFVNGLYFKDVL